MGGCYKNRAALAVIEHDVPHSYERARLEFPGGRSQRNDQAALAPSCALQEGIVVIQRLAGEIKLRHQAVALARDVEMYMRRPQTGVRASRIRAGLDGLHPVTPLRIGRQDGEAFEIGIE